MTADKMGRIVWHDLFTDDANASRSFYEKVAGWTYVIEHAKDFAWGGGERDFILAVSGGEAGAGFVALEDLPFAGWVPYIEVPDVDATAQKAVANQGSIEKAPFEVPGVGRNCLLRDPEGAMVGICLSRHTYPTPTKQFGPEVYFAQPGAFPADFYHTLFDWTLSPSSGPEAGHETVLRAGLPVGFTLESERRPPLWSPSVRVSQLFEALEHTTDAEGSVIGQFESAPNGAPAALVTDQRGAHCCLVQELP